MNKPKQPLRTFNLSLAVAGLIIAGTAWGADPPQNVPASKVDDAALAAAGEASADWLTHGLNPYEDRYSRLDQINQGNIKQLGLAWATKIGLTQGIEATPIVADGIMYFTGMWSIVYAVDCRDGSILWAWDPGVDRAVNGGKPCCGVVNRGVALYKGRIYVGVIDGRLVSLDARTGKPVWEVVTVDQSKHYTITGAPRVVDGKVIIGNGGAEFGVRGFFSAFDWKTGKRLWRTYTVPGNPADGFENPDMEKAAKTWHGEWWTNGGGGTCWDAFAYDPELRILYVGTGNGGPWPRETRTANKGDNLYLCAILAVNPENGRILWHYQTTPGDNWDYTSVQQMILADIEWKGRPRKVIMQAPKNGFFYVLDRKTGELLAADAYSDVNWAERVDLKTGRPVETARSDYSKEAKKIKPGPFGAHNWHAMSYDPERGLVFIPAIELDFTYKVRESSKALPSFFDVDQDWILEQPEVDEEKRLGRLVAWDIKARKPRWEMWRLGPYNGGTLSTAGDLLFQGNAEGFFEAYDPDTGGRLWSYFTGLAIISPPVTYTLDGQQVVSVIAGWGGAYGKNNPPAGKSADYLQEAAIFTFRLGGKAEPPELIPNPRTKLTGPDLDFVVDMEAVERGRKHYKNNCGFCHGPVDGPAGTIPDLGTSPAEIHKLWQQIVGDGLFAAAKGMPAFGSVFTKEQIADIQHYVIQTSREEAVKAK